ncbi:MAG: hypothetical protein AAF997_15355 [Myxococcota bacterium]
MILRMPWAILVIAAGCGDAATTGEGGAGGLAGVGGSAAVGGTSGAGGDGAGGTLGRACDLNSECADEEECVGNAGGPRSCVSTSLLGELVVCDQVEVTEVPDGVTTRFEKAVFPNVAPGTATFVFCDFFATFDGEVSQLNNYCTEDQNPSPGFYQDGDLHVVCSEEVTLPGGGASGSTALRTYVRLDDAAP